MVKRWDEEPEHHIRIMESRDYAKFIAKENKRLERQK